MKFKRMIVLLITALSLTSCSDSKAKNEEKITVRTSRVTKDTVGSIKADDSNVVTLHDGELTLPKEYSYSVQETEDLKTYFVFSPQKCNKIADEKDQRKTGEYEKAIKEAWETAKQKAVGNKDTDGHDEDFVFDTDAYITPYNENVQFMIMEGVDRATPNNELKKREVNQSMSIYFKRSFGESIVLRNTQNYFCVPYPTLDVNLNNVPEKERWLYDDKINGKYYNYTTITYSGDYMTTTYGINCFPHTYYCIYLMEKENYSGSLRRWYGFVFCNDSVGDMFSEKDYNAMMEQIKEVFGITLFPTQQYNKDALNYDEKYDIRDGATYEQLEDMFATTKQFYTMYENKVVNLDELSDEEVQKDDSITEIKFG